MKQFFGAFLGSVIGIVLATIIVVVIIVASIKASFGSLNAKDESDVSVVKTNSVLKLLLDGQIADREKENPFKDFGDLGTLMDQGGSGLNTMLDKISKAKNDDKIKGIFLYAKNLEAGFATIEELRGALEGFKKSGKFIYSYAENYGQKEYYLASVANKVFLNPQGA